MNNKQAKKIRKECKGLAAESVYTVAVRLLNAMQDTADKASFGKRLKNGLGYIFKKDISFLFPEAQNNDNI